MKCIICGINSEYQELCIFCRDIPIEQHIKSIDGHINRYQKLRAKLVELKGTHENLTSAPEKEMVRPD